MGGLSMSSNGSVLDCNNIIDSYPSDGCCIALDCLVNETYANVDFDEYKSGLRCAFEQMLSVLVKEISCRGVVRPVPAVLGDGGSLNLFELFTVVRDKGGSDAVSEKELWSLVVVELGLDVKMSASVKLIYSKYLRELEEWLMVRSEGRKLENAGYHCEGSFRFFSELEAKFKDVFSCVFRENRVYDKCYEFIANKQIGNTQFAAGDNETKYPKAKKNELHGDFIKFPKNYGETLNDDCENGCININEDCKILDSANVESENISHERSRESLLRMLKWVRRIAKHPEDPSNGIPPPSKWQEFPSNDMFWIQVLRARNSLLIRKIDEAKTKEHLLQKKVKVHPSIYEDNIDNHHLSTERIRCSARLITLVGSEVTSCNNSCSTIQSNLINSTTAENEKDLGKQGFLNDDLQLTGEGTHHDEDSVEKLVPVGAIFQAVIPEWMGKISDSDSKWLGTQVWPSQHKSHNSIIHVNHIGRGRPDSCSCLFRGSVECVRFHIAEARMKLKLELGLAFYHWRFNHMGEEISLRWTTDEEKRFKDMVRANFNSQSKCFWKHLLKCFPMKSRKNLISYYFNVFLIQQRSYQNRVTPNSIDSDDDEVELSPMVGDFGNKAIQLLRTESQECSENKQCTDML